MFTFACVYFDQILGRLPFLGALQRSVQRIGMLFIIENYGKPLSERLADPLPAPPASSSVSREQQTVKGARVSSAALNSSEKTNLVMRAWFDVSVRMHERNLICIVSEHERRRRSDSIDSDRARPVGGRHGRKVHTARKTPALPVYSTIIRLLGLAVCSSLLCSSSSNFVCFLPVVY